jgi:predicted TIM-barrel fold metal-dependent hydrolase
MFFDVKSIDRQIYREKLSGFLPSKIVDVHTHVWLKSFIHESQEAQSTARTVSWPSRVAKDNAIEDLLETYNLMLPDKTVTPVIFGSPNRTVDLAATNDYVSQSARAHRLPGLLVSTPAWSAPQLKQKVLQGGFLGLKPYLSFAPAEIPAGEITIFDYLPHAHLEVAEAHGWVIMLHIPRAARLRDPVNLAQLLEIERTYPSIRLIVAHIGRAYCREDVGEAFEMLEQTSHMQFDFSANTNSWVMAQMIRTVGPQRIVFGSDLPILRMRMRRICEDGEYINLVPPGLYGDVGGDIHMREVSQDEEQRLSFFLYEEILAFQKATEATGLTTAEVQDIFYNNAASLFGIA